MPADGEGTSVDVPEHGLGSAVFEADEIAQGDQIDFDANGVPPAWDDGDGVDQATLTNTILAQSSTDDSFNQRYDDILEKDVLLSEFRTMYVHGEDELVREQALRLLKQKIRVKVDRKYEHAKDSKDIVYTNTGVSVFAVRRVCLS